MMCIIITFRHFPQNIIRWHYVALNVQSSILYIHAILIVYLNHITYFRISLIFFYFTVFFSVYKICNAIPTLAKIS